MQLQLLQVELLDMLKLVREEGLANCLEYLFLYIFVYTAVDNKKLPTLWNVY